MRAAQTGADVICIEKNGFIGGDTSSMPERWLRPTPGFRKRS
ncbi:MAG: hypothetical protein ACLSA6_02880 [Holdemania massiliensis]